MFWRGVSCAAPGIALGSVFALFATRGLDGLLSLAQRVEPITWVWAWNLPLTVGAAACWVTASSAARTDPIAALQE